MPDYQMTLRRGDAIVYCPLACDGHYRGVVVARHSDGLVDIDVNDELAGLQRDPLRLENIAVVPTLKDLAPATCTRAVE